MISGKTTVMTVSVVVLLLTFAIGEKASAQEGPRMVGPRPEQPFGPGQPFEIMREYAEAMRARSREAQELADRLRREADGLDEFIKARFGPVMGPMAGDGRQRELTEIKEAIGRAERDGRWEEVAELRRHAERLRNEMWAPKRGPGMEERDEIRGRIEHLRHEAAKAKDKGRFEESQRLWDEAQGIEMKAQREQEIRGMKEHIGAMRDKAAMLREQSQQAKREGRHREAKEQWEVAEQIEREVQGGIHKIERFRAESEVKDLRIMAERAAKQGDHEKAEAPPSKEARRRKERLGDTPKGPAQDGDLVRVVEELRGEIKQLRREMEEMRTRLDQREAR